MKGVVALLLRFLHSDIICFDGFLVACHFDAELFALTQVDVSIAVHDDVDKIIQFEGLGHYLAPFLAVAEIVLAKGRLALLQAVIV